METCAPAVAPRSYPRVGLPSIRSSGCTIVFLIDYERPSVLRCRAHLRERGNRIPGCRAVGAACWGRDAGSDCVVWGTPLLLEPHDKLREGRHHQVLQGTPTHSYGIKRIMQASTPEYAHFKYLCLSVCSALFPNSTISFSEIRDPY